MPSVVIAGGTGLIGRKLTSYLIDRHYEVVILTREKSMTSSEKGVSYSFWDIANQVIDPKIFRNADSVIHLAGSGIIDKKWSRSYKEEILNSRVKSGSLLVKTLTASSNKVQSFIANTAIGWYGADNNLTHKGGFIETDPPAKGFLGETCLQWENSIDAAAPLGIRIIKFRTGIVLSNKGGAYPKFKVPLKFGIAGIMGNGRQIMSWIHIDDLCRMYISAIENKDINGTYNAVAPNPVTNKKFIIEMAEKVRRKFYIPVYVPGLFLKLILGKRSIEVLKSATISSQKIKSTGFTFLYPSIESSIEELESY